MRNSLLFIIMASMGAMAQELVVHEWGTFTSFMGSDGKRQEGMHHEEETLPNFVYGFQNPQSEAQLPDFGIKCFAGKIGCHFLNTLSLANHAAEIMPKNPVGAGITQKMETPVIYFYGDVGQKVSVDISFPKGIISQYYPKATHYSPKYNEAKTLGPSRFTFNVELLAKDAVNNLPATLPHSVWNPSRQVNANSIYADGEYEKFIFYRGVGDFDSNVTVTNDGTNLTVLNRSSAPITHAFILNFDGIRGAIKPLPAIAQKTSARIPTPDMKLPEHAYIAKAKDLIVKALVASGLFLDEARAMVNTWEKSYFKTPGVRLLYLVPRIETDAILPLTITPNPDHVVRTLIGRVEIMTKHEENKLLHQIATNPQVNLKLGHYTEPKLRRLLDISKSMPNQGKKIAQTITKLIAQAR